MVTAHNARAERGQRAEAGACDYLQRQGLRLVERNYRCARGEIDLIMRDQETLVFVEVRYRASQRFGGAAASVDTRKQARLVAAALHYLQQHPAAGRRACRFDVMASVPGEGDVAVEYEWIRSAFEAG